MGMLDLSATCGSARGGTLETPQDDIITFLLESEMNGEKLDPFHVGRTIGLLLIAGIDTTWSAIGASIWHLAKTPADRQRLVDEPDLMPVAMEELLRAYAPVTVARLGKEDMDFNGCPMKANEWVLLPFPSANRFLRRSTGPTRWSSTGRRTTRCLRARRPSLRRLPFLADGIARRVGGVARGLPRVPLADPAAVRWSGGQVRGPRTLPVRVG